MRAVLPMILLLLPVGALHGAEPDVTPGAGPLAVVEALMRAFNDHDVEAMLEQVTEDVELIYVDGGTSAVGATGKQTLGKEMRGYFAALPTVRSKLEGSMVSEGSRFVTVRERVTWDPGDGQQRSQASVAVYEIEDGLIARVWYYPAEQ